MKKIRVKNFLNLKASTKILKAVKKYFSCQLVNKLLAITEIQLYKYKKTQFKWFKNIPFNKKIENKRN